MRRFQSSEVLCPRKVSESLRRILGCIHCASSSLRPVWRIAARTEIEPEKVPQQASRGFWASEWSLGTRPWRWLCSGAPSPEQASRWLLRARWPDSTSGPCVCTGIRLPVECLFRSVGWLVWERPPREHWWVRRHEADCGWRRAEYSAGRHEAESDSCRPARLIRHSRYSSLFARGQYQRLGDTSRALVLRKWVPGFGRSICLQITLEFKQFSSVFDYPRMDRNRRSNRTGRKQAASRCPARCASSIDLPCTSFQQYRRRRAIVLLSSSF